MHVENVLIEHFKTQLSDGIKDCRFRDVTSLLSKLDALQEQPQSLDPYLQDLIDPVVSILQSSLVREPLDPFHADLYHILYYYTKIRGAKVIVKFLPNDVYLMEKLLDCLQAQPIADSSLWQSRYILLLWLSLVSMAPFALKTFDTDQSSNMRIGLVERLGPLAESYLDASGKEREAAGILIARLLTRKDVSTLYIPDFINRSMGKWSLPTCSINYQTGLLTCLCEIFKIGNRDVLLPHIDAGIRAVLEMDQHADLEGNSLIRKLRIKFAQRLALTVLKPKRASWRYHNNPKELDGGESVSEEEVAVEDPPDLVEEVVGILLNALQDKDTIVRYSAAKGIGRISSRLPMQYTYEIVEAIQDLLQADIKHTSDGPRLVDVAKDATWNGCCLAIAELCRNGALMPEALRNLFPLIFQALKFDIKRGSHSVGTAVRDAACYVIWSMLRCYKTAVLLAYLEEVATTLIVVALFDREISVRRAASAAFQEGVGRHPDDAFPDGIAVLSKADFHAVGQRRVAFLEVAPDVYHHVAYRRKILTHLSNVSCVHWDRGVREHAGQSLGKIFMIEMDTPAQRLHEMFDVVTELRRRRDDVDVNARHGSFYATGEICGTLLKFSHGKKITLSSSQKDVLFTFCAALPKYNFTGPQAALMYTGVCHYIQNVASLERALQNSKSSSTSESSKLHDVDHGPERHEEQFALACNAFLLSDEDVRISAASAVAELFHFEVIARQVETLFDKIDPSRAFSVRTPSVEKGWLTVFGQLIYSNRPNLLLATFRIMVASASIKGEQSRDDPETRKLAITSLGDIVPQLTALNSVDRSNAFDTFAVLQDSLYSGLTDYTIDARGDVGSWVREAAIRSTAKVLRIPDARCLVASHPANPTRLFSKALGQCLGKIDNLRICALQELLGLCQSLVETGKDLLLDLGDLCKAVLPILQHAASHIESGGASTTLFANLVVLLDLSDLRKDLIREYLISSNSGSHSTMSSASTAIQTFLEHQSDDYLAQVLNDISLDIEQAKDDDRVLIPLLSSIADLLEAQVFMTAEYDYSRLFSNIQNSCLNSRNLAKISASLKCYGALACLEDPVKLRAWKKLGLTLAHPFPRIRVMAAELLYTILSTLDLEGENEELIQVLTMHDWSTVPEKELVAMIKAFDLPLAAKEL